MLLTGSTGMLGQNILDHSGFEKFEIFAPRSSELNLLNYKSILDYLKNNRIEIVIHAAGKVGGIQANIKQPVEFLNDNLLMGINLVNAASMSGVTRFINLGSSCMYPRNYKNPLKEEFILQAALEPTNEGYALAKITVAKLCEYISKQYGLNFKTIIPCNLYGKFDKFDDKNSHMIPAVIKKIYQAKINNQQEVDIWGDGLARREFMYASDCAGGILFAINNLDKLDSYTNLGLGYDYSINEYYQAIANIIGYKGKFRNDLTKPVGMQQKLVDITKMKNLGWVAETSVEDGIKKTFEFYVEGLN